MRRLKVHKTLWERGLPAKNDNGVYQKKLHEQECQLAGCNTYSVIVTKSVNGVYQKPIYMHAGPPLKISLANQAKAINPVTALTKAVNPKVP